MFPKQVIEKCKYYKHAKWAQREKAIEWAINIYSSLKRPFRVHNVYNHPSWLERFHGEHPPQIIEMFQDIRNGKLNIELKQTKDIEDLLVSKYYILTRYIIKWAFYINKTLTLRKLVTKSR